MSLLIFPHFALKFSAFKIILSLFIYFINCRSVCWPFECYESWQ